MHSSHLQLQQKAASAEEALASVNAEMDFGQELPLYLELPVIVVHAAAANLDLQFMDNNFWIENVLLFVFKTWKINFAYNFF